LKIFETKFSRWYNDENRKLAQVSELHANHTEHHSRYFRFSHRENAKRSSRYSQTL